MFALIALAMAYAFADRFAGGGWPALDDKLPGRAAFWGGILGAAVGFLAAGLAGALLALVWLIWRTPGWKLIPPGSATPRTAMEITATFARHAIPIPLAAVVALWTGHDIARAASLMFVFALAATALAAWYGKKVADPEADADDAADANHFLEAFRGAVYGACVAVGLGA